MFVDRFRGGREGQECSWIDFADVAEATSVRGSNLLRAHLDAALVVRGTPSLPLDGGEGWGEEGRLSQEWPLSPALSPLVPHGAREKSDPNELGNTASRCVRLLPGEVAVVAASGELSMAGGLGLGAAGRAVPWVMVLASAVLRNGWPARMRRS